MTLETDLKLTTAGTAHMDLPDLVENYGKLCAGERMIYALGRLSEAVDSWAGAELWKVRERAQLLAQEGKVLLTQRRAGNRGDGIFEYWLTKRKTSGPAAWASWLPGGSNYESMSLHRRPLPPRREPAGVSPQRAANGQFKPQRELCTGTLAND